MRNELSADDRMSIGIARHLWTDGITFYLLGQMLLLLICYHDLLVPVVPWETVSATQPFSSASDTHTRGEVFCVVTAKLSRKHKMQSASEDVMVHVCRT